MNVFLSLDPEEVEVLMDYHAGKIGQVDEDACDRACKRIHQLQRTLAPELTSPEWEPAFEGKLAA